MPIFFTFLLAGIWHGAGWTFVVFGLIHGLAMATNHAWRQSGAPELPAPLGWLLTMSVVIIGLVFFRAQDVTTAEVLAAMQNVAGVVAVDLDLLDGVDPFTVPRLTARPARWEGGAIQPAELLTLDPGGLVLTTRTP